MLIDASFTGLRANVAPLSPKAEISIERLLWWAYGPGRPGGRTWIVDRELSMDRGLTARPRRRERGSWLLVEACAGMRLRQTATVTVLGTLDRDAGLIDAIVDGLPHRQAEAVRRYARGKSRPDWLDTAWRLEGERDERGRGIVKWTNNRHRKVQYCPLRVVVERRLTEMSQRRWTDWRAGLLATSGAVGGRLERWKLSGSLPVDEPWRTP